MPTTSATNRSWWLSTEALHDTDESSTRSLDHVDRTLIAVAFVLPLAYFDAFLVPSFTPRMALVLLLLPIGAMRWLRAALQRDLASTAAFAMLILCGAATLVGDAPLWNLRGGFARESSLLFIGGIFSIWALARETSTDGRRLVAAASILGLAATGLIGIVQLLVEPSGFLKMIGSRPSGLMVNPVYFGPAMAGAAVFVAHLSARGSIRPLVGVGGITLFTACVNLSGSRAGAIGLFGGTVCAIVVADTARTRAAIAGSTVSGLLVSTLLVRGSGGRDALERATGGSDGRWEIWTYAWEAFRDRPVAGHGLGQFRPAVQTHFEPEFVSEYLTREGGVAWPDAHNVIVQYAVVGGLFTAMSLVAFAGLAGRQARGPAAWATAALTVSWLLQPVTLVTAPIAAIWLGIASPPPTPDQGPGRRTDLLLLGVGGLLALTLLGLDRQLDRAAAHADAQEFTAWAKVAPDDPVIAATSADLSTRFGSRGVGLDWSERAVELEPEDATVITGHAIRLFDAGRTEESVAVIRVALEVDPYNPYALRIAAAIGSALDDNELVASVRLRGCLVLEELCDDE